ncbi:molybdenum cofactor guanylyltransferase [Paenibacillus sp. ATY16]|uniref:molybdenum cofactor guanylyltransferase n=1 Tax=Paenibacillus sp. ATY16 TaxID=1759312 RepID=UPI00200FDB65
MVSGVILAGDVCGTERADERAFLVVEGQSLLHRQIKEMKSLCAEVTIVTNHPQPFLRHVDRDIRIISDYYAGQGILSGMHAGLALARYPDVWMLGCHMPHPSAAAASLLLLWRREGYDAVIPLIGGRIYPLHGIYDRALSEPIGAMLEEGHTDVEYLLQQIHWLKLKEPTFRSNRIDSRFVRTVPVREP